LVASLTLFTVQLLAQDKGVGLSDSAAIARPPTNSLNNAQDVEEYFDTLIAKQLREEHVAGATVAVVKDGHLVFAEGYGYADREQREPVVADETLFYPGSAGKLFTWTAVMQLVEEGKLDLETDINTYLDFEFPDTYPEPITMADLMTHTAGFEEQFAAQLIEKERDVPAPRPTTGKPRC
jgi:CubicO group peptidase (beta-lactamase class C family)